jgi:hypothetical protein
MFSNHQVNRLYMRVSVVVLTLGLLTGCCEEPIDSDIGTDSIHADMLLTCADNSTEVRVKLSSSQSTGADIYLSQGDELIATANGQSQTLAEEQLLFNVVQHTTTFDVDDPGTQVTISFERSNYVSAPNSTILLPEHLTIQTPQPGQTFTRQDNIPLSWDPSGTPEEIDVQFTVTCHAGNDTSSRTRYFTTGDSGSTAYAIADLLSEWEDLDASATCTADITLTRRTTGSLDPAFRGGGIVAQRADTVSVEIAP